MSAQTATPSQQMASTSMDQFAAVSSIFDAAEMVIYVADMDTHELLFMNTHAERLWGTQKIGEPCFKVLQADQTAPCQFCTNSKLTARGVPMQPVVWEFQNTVNKRWYLCIDKAIPWSDGRLVRMEVAIDITEHKRHEQFRQQYIGLISHDLRSPLSTISHAAAVLKLLAQRNELTAGAPQADVILRNTERMARMIDDVLETTRLESGEFKLNKTWFDLAQLARDVGEQLGAAASRVVTFDAGPAVQVCADAARIERVLDNLIGNALRYSPADSPIHVRVDAQENEVVASVTDQGIGIAPDDVPKLFQRFYRARDNKVDGLGLGLYNSRSIVESHAGRIWAHSTPGQGSTFYFAVPRGPAAAGG